ncbi:hypothetical protein A2936_04845 [Candidatus Uhrbacteria bacterium RIFCSPLOWO2_01_FULL_47_25]|uniref:Uncharacterized protein n=1 Tax=Candidatus Uhrbacteria bacterium RIFCSPLOWO2_01_FULL_47_25 TaxID=1802402 RepID=A0A1F7UWF6_9BACT|nr:MAG: hypothetical protein A2936_04845 [Candidatus Uhrbacteria bacterium RIFCSPLOWO2_01_FULL_47_25]
MAIFATPSPKHERVPKIKRYCTNCKREQEVKLDDELCPICHEASLLPPPEKQRQDRKAV